MNADNDKTQASRLLSYGLMATFFFRAVASDGKVRSGSLTGDNEKLVARELRKQGLTPVYVGVAPKGVVVRNQAAVVRQGQAARRSVLHAGAFHAAECRACRSTARFPSPPN